MDLRYRKLRKEKPRIRETLINIISQSESVSTDCVFRKWNLGHSFLELCRFWGRLSYGGTFIPIPAVSFQVEADHWHHAPRSSPPSHSSPLVQWRPLSSPLKSKLSGGITFFAPAEWNQWRRPVESVSLAFPWETADMSQSGHVSASLVIKGYLGLHLTNSLVYSLSWFRSWAERRFAMYYPMPLCPQNSPLVSNKFTSINQITKSSNVTVKWGFVINLLPFNTIRQHTIELTGHLSCSPFFIGCLTCIIPYTPFCS